MWESASTAKCRSDRGPLKAVYSYGTITGSLIWVSIYTWSYNLYSYARTVRDILDIHVRFHAKIHVLHVSLHEIGILLCIILPQQLYTTVGMWSMYIVWSTSCHSIAIDCIFCWFMHAMYNNYVSAGNVRDHASCKKSLLAAAWVIV